MNRQIYRSEFHLIPQINTNFRLGNSFLMKIGLQELKFRQDKNLWVIYSLKYFNQDYL